MSKFCYIAWKPKLVKQYQVARMKKKKKRKEKRSCLKDEVLNKDKGDGQVYWGWNTFIYIALFLICSFFTTWNNILKILTEIYILWLKTICWVEWPLRHNLQRWLVHVKCLLYPWYVISFNVSFYNSNISPLFKLETKIQRNRIGI